MHLKVVGRQVLVPMSVIGLVAMGVIGLVANVSDRSSRNGSDGCGGEGCPSSCVQGTRLGQLVP